MAEFIIDDSGNQIPIANGTGTTNGYPVNPVTTTNNLGYGNQLGNIGDSFSKFGDQFSTSHGVGNNAYTNGQMLLNGLGLGQNVYSGLRNYKLAKEQMNNQKEYQKFNALADASNQLGSLDQLAQARASNGMDISGLVNQGQTVVNAIGNLGADTTGLNNQLNNIKKFNNMLS